MAEIGRKHALAIPFPAQGHLNPMMRFCNILASQGYTVTILNVDTVHDRIVEQQEPQIDTASHGDIDHHQHELDIRKAYLPVEGVDLSNGFNLSFEQFHESLRGLSDSLERFIETLNQGDLPVTCLVSDVMMTACTQKVADKFNIPRVALFVYSLGMHLLLYYLIQDETLTKDVLDVVLNKNEKLKGEVFRGDLVGLPMLRNGDLPHGRHIHDDTEYIYANAIQECKETNKRAHAIVVNSFVELESAAFEALQSRLDIPILPVGPLVEHDSTLSLWKEDITCLEWLDQQPPQSVLYISFGSITLLSESQFQEIVSGLLSSQRRFLWVIRPDLVASSAQFDFPTFLSDFLSKCKDRGYVVSWAPQTRVLSHPSVGGFLTHCGWNSVIEAISHGVPMLCWPYFVDQFFDANYIVEEWNVGLGFEASGEDGLIKRDEVERVIRAFHQGEKGSNLRKNVIKLKEAGWQSLSPGGTSHKNIQALIQSLKDQPPNICQRK